MKRPFAKLAWAPLLFFPLLSSFILPPAEPPWGFFGHRRINRLAVFTLPAEMGVFYKRHIEYITDHAVDPDKRRYATRHEAVRHYIDLDHWGHFPFPEVPRDWTDALALYTSMGAITHSGDTLMLFGPGRHRKIGDQLFVEGGWLQGQTDSLPYRQYRRLFREVWMPQYYEDSWACSCDTLENMLAISIPDCRTVFAVDSFSGFGILPYHLLAMQRRLTSAFEERDAEKIIRLSTEMGHYIGDAHVPLHTTENYNGQLTGQDGIHAFWESRLPELYADAHYDYWLGPSRYIEDPGAYYWEVVLASHELLDSVLGVEKLLSNTYPSDQQFCYEERLGATIRTQCEAYAGAYHERLGGQVEARMRAAILAVGSAWYTAWVDAGSPDLRDLGNQAGGGGEDAPQPGAPEEKGSVIVRPHE